MKDFRSLRIIFMGTPEFAVASLDALVKAGCNIVGVITAPDKAAGRGMQLQQSAVKNYAVENNLNILQPETANPVAANHCKPGRSPRINQASIPAKIGALPMATIVPTATPVRVTAAKKQS
jgi:hypothetical protein